MPDGIFFEEDREFVEAHLREGFLDHLEMVSRVIESKFFQMLLGSGDLGRFAQSFPTPRQKQEVPLWLYLSTQITLRLHGATGYSSLPYVLHCGGLRDALEQGQVERKQEADGSTHLSFRGYNDKNSYDRATPCDQDFVRKLARATVPGRLEAWFGTEVPRYFRRHKAFDDEGIFIADGSYLFVPDNPRYENSAVAFFDKHNHPIKKKEEEKLPLRDRRKCRFQRYYQMVSLCHTNRSKDYLLFVGSHVLTEGGEVNALVPLVDGFVGAVGRGVMKVLLVDRGFIDGPSITRIKKEHKVDVIVPLKAGMDITNDAWRLAECDGKPWQVWVPPEKEPVPEPEDRPEWIRRAERSRQKKLAENKLAEKKRNAPKTPTKPRVVRVELKVIPMIDLWKTCKVPLDVVLLREHMSDGEVLSWGLMTTKRVVDPLEIWQLYGIRPSVEEGWRQIKGFWDLTGFRSCSFSLIVNQVVFILLAYSLLQLFLVKSDRGELAKATRTRLLSELLPHGEKIAIYYQNRVGYFSPTEYTDLILNLAEGARRRLAGTIRRLRKSQLEPPALGRRPA